MKVVCCQSDTSINSGNPFGVVIHHNRRRIGWEECENRINAPARNICENVARFYRKSQATAHIFERDLDLVKALRRKPPRPSGYPVNGVVRNFFQPNTLEVTVFKVREGTNWIQQAYLKASNKGGVTGSGFSVSAMGDTSVIGASHEDSNATGVNGNQTNNSATDSRAAYVFGLARSAHGSADQRAEADSPCRASSF